MLVLVRLGGGLAALVFYTVHGLTLVQGDSIGLLFIPRWMIDSLTPSFPAIGGIESCG